MKKLNWRLVVCILLLIFSAVCYTLQIRIFHKPHDTFFYLLQDLAFVPIQVLLVTIIIQLSKAEPVPALQSTPRGGRAPATGPGPQRASPRTRSRRAPPAPCCRRPRR